MRKLLISLTVLVAAGFSLSSCLKEAKVEDPGFDIQVIGSNTTTIMEVPLDVYLQADRAIRFQRDSIISKNINQASLNFKMGYISLTVTPADTVTYPKTIELDFGSDPLMPYQGKMTITMNGNMWVSGSKCALNYQGLVSAGNSILGNDSIISQGKNSSGSIVSHFVMHGGELKDVNAKKITYTGNIIGKFNLTSKVNLLDSVSINATDVNLNDYRLYSIPTYKLQIAKGCSFFNTGVISADIKVKGVLTGVMAFDYGYSNPQYGTVNGCDSDGALYISSKTNLNYSGQYNFYAKEFR